MMPTTPRGPLARHVLMVLACLLVARPGYGQMMPGMEPEPGKSDAKAGQPEDAATPKAKPTTIQEKKQALALRVEQENLRGAQRLYESYLGEDSPYRGVLLSIVTVIVLLFLKRHTTRLMRDYALARAHKPGNVGGRARAAGHISGRDEYHREHEADPYARPSGDQRGRKGRRNGPSRRRQEEEA